MKPKIFTSIMLFISGYSPLMIMLLIKDFDFKAKNPYFKHPITVYIVIGSIIISWLLLYFTFTLIKRGNMSIKVISVKNRSSDIINYTIPYMLGFIGVDLSKPEDLVSISIFLLILLNLTITTKTIFINPILSLFGYCLYDLEYEFDSKPFSTTILSRKEIKSGEHYYIRSLTRFLYLITEKVK